MQDIFTIANKHFKSRIIVGTGKYKTFEETANEVTFSDPIAKETLKQNKIEISVRISERLLPHHYDSEKFRGSSPQSHCSP